MRTLQNQKKKKAREFKEKAHADVLQLEVNSLSKELTFRSHASKGVTGNSKNPCARNQFMTFQLPSLLTVSPEMVEIKNDIISGSFGTVNVVSP